jgi:two-component system response regulator GlrR
MTRLLIVDDVAAMAEQYAYDLKRLAGYEVKVATNGPAAIEAVGGARWIASSSISRCRAWMVSRCSGSSGTGHRDADHRVHRHRQLRPLRPGGAAGCAGFIDKAEPMERVVQEVGAAIERAQLRREVRTLQRMLGTSSLLGHSRLWNAPADHRAGGTGAQHVLILGESGSGKEVVARELHGWAPIRPGSSSPSTAPRCLSTWWRASCSVTSGALSPAPSACGRAPLRSPTRHPVAG